MSADEPRRALLEFLRAEGAAELAHGGGRTLLDHLTGTAAILERWEQPEWLQHAALVHSVYGTERFQAQLLSPRRRGELRELAGERAERLAFLFCVTPRGQLLSRVHAWSSGLPRRPLAGELEAAEEPAASREEIDAMVMLHMANLAEQARSEDGSPGAWLARLRDLAELLIDSDTIALPLFVARLAGLSEADEELARRSYRAGVSAAAAPEERASGLGLAAALLPVVGEPCLRQAELAHERGDFAGAGLWARAARERLVGLGCAWDKRLSYEEWLSRAQALEEAPGEAAVSPAPERAGLRRRFHRYVEALGDPEGPAARGVYPELSSRPWYEPRDFPLARYLESHGEEIRAEILALDPASFQPESEAIRRTGDWEVVFLYERGRRNAIVADRCPVTMRGIESGSTVLTSAGLSYASRMRPGTHIAAHRGPTNLRLRCHLGIEVPGGDCAIRVGEETRRWETGRCLVFDDHFEHEAWNRTAADRIVLIVDVWHPDLSAAEVALLGGLHRHIDAQARRLSRYWQANAAAAGRRT